VTIPVQVRRAAGIEAGMPLVVYVEDGRIVIETREQLADPHSPRRRRSLDR
jgi:bifunctional DNA-binding transcriptional regulator/antitoxin component of YhaV-PrlF toxin-antitoxin module